MLTPFPINRFGGLNLNEEPDEGGPQSAVDVLNVDFDRQGAVRVRDGYSKVNSSGTAVSLKYVLSAGGNGYVYGWGNSDHKLYPIRTLTGVVGTASSAYTAVCPQAAAFGTGTSAYVYVPANTIVRIASGTTFSQPAGMPAASFLAVQPRENRLVSVHPTSLLTSRVAFSAAGDAETWNNPTVALGTAGDYVELDPNDGEYLTSPVAWNGQLFVFKQTKFYVFYGNTEDADGNPVFNYRTINNGIGATFNYAPAAVATPDGVYFTGADGIYRTTGSNPVKVSGSLDPLFRGTSAPFFSITGPPQGGTNPGMAYLRDRVYSTFTCDGSTYITLVYNIVTESWTVWQYAATPTNFCIAPLFLNDGFPDRLAFASGTFVYTSQPSDTTDAGTAIPSRYRSSFYSPINSTSQQVAILESQIDGVGTPTFSLSADYGAVPTSGGGAKAQVTLGTAPAYGTDEHRVSQHARRFSYQIEATSGFWQVNSIVQQIKSIRAPGLR